MDFSKTQLAKTIRILRKQDNPASKCEGNNENQIKKTVNNLKGKK